MIMDRSVSAIVDWGTRNRRALGLPLLSERPDLDAVPASLKMAQGCVPRQVVKVLTHLLGRAVSGHFISKKQRLGVPDGRDPFSGFDWLRHQLRFASIEKIDYQDIAK